MQVGDLITHNPTGAVGIIVEDFGRTVCVVWCYDPTNGAEGYNEIIEKMFIENLKSDKK